MSRRRFTAIRRAIASVLLLCFISYGAEAAVADVHDQEQNSIAGSAAYGVSTLAHAPPESGGPDLPVDNHAFHVCHCSHNHAGVLPVTPELAPTIVPVQQLQWPGASSLHNIPRAPLLRPPIA